MGRKYCEKKNNNLKIFLKKLTLFKTSMERLELTNDEDRHTQSSPPLWNLLRHEKFWPGQEGEVTQPEFSKHWEYKTTIELQRFSSSKESWCSKVTSWDFFR